MLYNGDIELVVKKSKILEGRLRRELNATGTGLGQLANSLKGKLPYRTSQELDEVVKMRNEIVHEEGRDTLESKNHFVRLCNNIEWSLDRMQEKGWRRWVVEIIIIALIIYCLSQNPP